MTAQTVNDVAAIGGLVVGAIVTHLAHTRAGKAAAKAIGAERERLHAWYTGHTTTGERAIITSAIHDAVQAAVDTSIKPVVSQVASLTVRATHLEAVQAQQPADPAKGA